MMDLFVEVPTQDMYNKTNSLESSVCEHDHQKTSLIPPNKKNTQTQFLALLFDKRSFKIFAKI